MKILIAFIFILLSVISCAQQGGNHGEERKNKTVYKKIPINNIEKITVNVKTISDFPIDTVKNLIIEDFTSKGYQVLMRNETLEEIKREHKIKDSSQNGYSSHIQGADAMLFIEVTEWRKRSDHGYTYVEKLAMVAKLVDPDTGGIVWIKNAFPSQGRNKAGLIGALVALPFDILIGSSDRTDPISDVVYQILSSFPSRYDDHINTSSVN